MINPVVLLLIQIITQCLSFRNLFSYKYIQDRFFDERILSEPRILISTSAADNGINLKDNRIRHIFSELINIDSLIQSLGRKRYTTDLDKCTYYIKEYDPRGIQFFINKAETNIDAKKEYDNDYKFKDKF